MTPLTEIAQQAWLSYLRPGAWAIDATAGNGLDTEFLARAVSETGRVFAYDIQDAAIKSTAGRLDKAGLLSRVTLIKADHAELSGHLPCSSHSRIDLICFNLGYLPSGDHSVTTRPLTTLRAIKESLKLLKPSGALSIMAYRGHAGAMEETEAVEHFVATLPQPWTCRQFVETGSKERPGPVWWLIAQEEFTPRSV
ncbi:methyltransferase domain-containing protein [Puniceicoccales bacterium CK1056]|uniref:Methyltransferase domain-containing protein n=1 Tax=Oceanipulchritudo coccoides TaxID=2706888 RepID=A0A6B2M190_9BACT|nr:class I SAM-dependent methyltransferase [Oceanipulchritudo coccoides]NDV62761.1 methyltransferase domain-containing protein [Oceanipulchritudo coccoides]